LQGSKDALIYPHLQKINVDGSCYSSLEHPMIYLDICLFSEPRDNCNEILK
jgi:hypothetical protein